MEPPELPKMINWQREQSYESGVQPLRQYLLDRLPYEVVLENTIFTIDLRDIEELIEKRWSAFHIPGMVMTEYYFFELETDAVAFKLRWME